MSPVENKSELFSTRVGAATVGAEIGALLATDIAAYQGNIPAELFNVAVAAAICMSNRELRKEVARIGKLVINLIKPKVKT